VLCLIGSTTRVVVDPTMHREVLVVLLDMSRNAGCPPEFAFTPDTSLELQLWKEVLTHAATDTQGFIDGGSTERVLQQAALPGVSSRKKGPSSLHPVGHVIDMQGMATRAYQSDLYPAVAC
jgi:hypothetical protein